MTVRFSPRTRALRLPLIVLGLGLSGAARAQPVTPPAPQLPAVTVPGAAVQETATGPVRGFVAERAVTATKTDAPVMETPQSISVITRDRMELQGAQSVQQATGYSAGVTANNRIDHRRDGVKIRGRTRPIIWTDCSTAPGTTTIPGRTPTRSNVSRSCAGRRACFTDKAPSAAF